MGSHGTGIAAAMPSPANQGTRGKLPQSCFLMPQTLQYCRPPYTHTMFINFGLHCFVDEGTLGLKVTLMVITNV